MLSGPGQQSVNQSVSVERVGGPRTSNITRLAAFPTFRTFDRRA